jgi:hypothetical protein
MLIFEGFKADIGGVVNEPGETKWLSLRLKPARHKSASVAGFDGGLTA